MPLRSGGEGEIGDVPEREGDEEKRAGDEPGEADNE
jgi:hypothetical protein